MYNVFGLGNALMDIQVFIEEDFLKNNGIQKGIMTLIDEQQSRNLLSAISKSNSVFVPGGSCGNTMSAIAVLGGKSIYTYVVSDDMYGRLFENKIVDRGVKSKVIKKDFGLTGTSIILTTKDAERTMLTHLGVCREFTKDDVDYSLLSESQVFHCTGYELDTESQKEALFESMSRAKKFNKKISFDIADPFCVSRNESEIKDLIKNYINILFGNQEEIKMLSKVNDPIEGGKKVVEMGAEIVIVKVGKEGSYVVTKDNVYKIPVYKVENPLDSTGCGDIYAGGFLYGLTNNYSIDKCGHIASYFASRIITVPGVQFELLNITEIKDFIKNL